MRPNMRSLPLMLAAASALVFSAGAGWATAQESEPQHDASAQQPSADQELDRAPMRDESPQRQDQAEDRNGDLQQDESAQMNREAVEDHESPPSRDTMREPEAMEQRSQSDTATEVESGVPNAITGAVQASFDALDTDHDGTIDRTEAAASAVLLNQFSALDTRGDGHLTIDEFAAANDIALIRNEHRDYEQE